nr:hypothetical protein [Sedimentibacter sp.]
MINIIICDDNDSFTYNIRKLIKENINFEYKVLSYENYTREFVSYIETNSTAYILKSYYNDNLLNAINTAYNSLMMKADLQNNDMGEIAICESKVDYRIKFKDIVYCEKITGGKNGQI